MRILKESFSRFFSGRRRSASPSGGGIRLDRSWAFYGVYLFWAAGFSPAVPVHGLFGSVVLGVATVSLGLLSALLHEFGHRFFSRILGVPYDGSRLSFWGGFPKDRVDFGPPVTASIVVRLAGPAMNILLWQISASTLTFAGGSWTVFFPELAYLVKIFSNLNALIAILNLFPGLPFDMGVVVSLVFCRAWGKDRPGEGSLPEKLGWVGGFAMSLMGLFFVARGLVVSGFGGMILGYLVLSLLLDFRERNQIARILEEEGILSWLEPIRALVRDDMWIQEVILGPFLKGEGGLIPVVSAKDGSYRGEISWEDLRMRSFARWEGMRVSDLEKIRPGPVIDFSDNPSRILEVLGQRQGGGAPVVREGRLIGWLRSDRLTMSGLIESYVDQSLSMSSRGDRPATPPEFVSSDDNSRGQKPNVGEPRQSSEL
jgi:Zn-dependent protease